MLIAVSTTRNGRKLLILGLQEENIERLLNDEPIYKNLATDVEILGIEDLKNWDLTVLGPEDTVRFIAQKGLLL